MKPYRGGDLLVFNNLITRPYKMTYLTLSLVEGVGEKKVTLSFLVILCMSTFKGILGRSFLAKLDVEAFPIHSKVTYHDKEGKDTMINIDLDEAKHIKEVTLKDIITLLVVVEEGSWKVSMFDLNVRKDEVRSV